MRHFLLLLSVTLPVLAHATTVSTLDDITFWVGTGDNRTAMAIDWQGDNTTSESLVWGYRWDDIDATAEDMLRDVLAADTRLYAKLSTFTGIGTSVIGLGYDASGDGDFALQDGTAFGSSGITNIAGTSDLVPPVDTNDDYAEGWFFGFWHLSQRMLGNWSTSNKGVSIDTLIDGRWHGFAFSPSFSTTAYPTNLLTASPPALAGDFNADGTVDAADYSVWRDGFGTEYTQADYIVWRDHFGDASNSTTFAIPEPATAWLVLSLLVTAWPVVCRGRV